MGSSGIQGPLWSDIADLWAEVMEPLRTPLYEAMLDACGVKAGTHVLDAGCGSGAASKRAALRSARIAGLDAAEGMIERARQQVPDGDFRIGDLEELPFEDKTFEVVLASDSIQFAEDKVAAITELGRVCQPDGVIAIALWDEPEKNEHRYVFSAMENELREPPKGGPFALSKRGLLEEMIGKAGLSLNSGDSVPLDFRYKDIDQFLHVTSLTGHAKALMRVAGEEKIKNAALSAAAQFVQPSGEVLIKNAFRFVTANP